MATTTSRRKIVVIALGSVLVVLLATFTALNAFSLKFLNPATTGQRVVFIGLSVLAFLVFVAVLFMLVRNVVKLYADQQSRVLGSRLRTRMMSGAILVSLIPLVFMFLFSYWLMNRAVDRWFSEPVAEMHDDSTRIADQLAQYTSANARVEAESISASLAVTEGISEAARGANNASDLEAIDGVLHQHEITLQDGFAIVYREGKAVAAFHLPQSTGAPAQVKPWLPPEPSAPDEDTDIAPSVHAPGDDLVVDGSTDEAILAAAQRTYLPIFSKGQTEYALGVAAIKEGGTVVVGLPTPVGMSATMTRLDQAVVAYWSIHQSQRQVRTLYLLLLIMMTTLALFASSWLALHLSKQVTKPVEALADAMEAIAAGDYATRVGESATEELGELVRSFNHMAADLEGSRRAAETSNLQLSAANATLEARRNELETMLEAIPNGVATLDSRRCVVLANRALTEMLDPGGKRFFIGTAIEEIFPAEAMESLDHLLRRSHRMGSASSEIEMTIVRSGNGSAATMHLLATVALLETGAGGERIHHGYVLVLEDATELLHAQKQSAWKEVARRVAHEIKNPLTPISLSAEQIRRHVDRLDSSLVSAQIESPSVAVVRRSAEVITASVESMRSLVDQFAALAEFPTAQPRPADLNTIVENSLALFAGRLQSIRLVKRLAPDLPLVLADPEAMQQSLLRDLRVMTCLLPSGMIELTVADTGSGLTDEMRERLFLPYFSTKQRGTGLGLSIAAKIIQEHQGSIRAEKNDPAGAKFIVELRPASSIEFDTATIDATLTASAAKATA